MIRAGRHHHFVAGHMPYAGDKIAMVAKAEMFTKHWQRNGIDHAIQPWRTSTQPSGFFGCMADQRVGNVLWGMAPADRWLVANSTAMSMPDYFRPLSRRTS
jgi:hypothetical protein